METPGLANGCFREIVAQYEQVNRPHDPHELPWKLQTSKAGLYQRRFQEAVEDQNRMRVRTRRFKMFQDMFEDVWSQNNIAICGARALSISNEFFAPGSQDLSAESGLARKVLSLGPTADSVVNHLNRQRREHRGASEAGDLEPISTHLDIFGLFGQDCSIHVGHFRTIHFEPMSILKIQNAMSLLLRCNSVVPMRQKCHDSASQSGDFANRQRIQKVHWQISIWLMFRPLLCCRGSYLLLLPSDSQC